MRDEDLVETIDEGEEVRLRYVVLLKGRRVCPSEWASKGTAERFGYFWRMSARIFRTKQVLKRLTGYDARKSQCLRGLRLCFEGFKR